MFFLAELSGLRGFFGDSGSHTRCKMNGDHPVDPVLYFVLISAYYHLIEINHIAKLCCNQLSLIFSLKFAFIDRTV